MAVGLVLSLSVTEPENLTPKPRSVSEALIAPFSEYFARSGVASRRFSAPFSGDLQIG